MTRRHSIGAVSQIPEGEGRAFQVGDRKIAVFRSREGRVFATQSDCPHRRGPLADGLLGGSTLVCPLHEWRFDLATGKSQNGACDLQVFPVTQDADGSLVVEMPAPNDQPQPQPAPSASKVHPLNAAAETDRSRP